MLGLDHVGVAVPNLAEALARWAPLVGPPESPPELVASNGVRVAFIVVGGTHLELLEPSEPRSPVARFLASRGPGVHHLAFRVPNVDRALAEVRERGGQTVDASGRPGARGRRVGFAHPGAFGGVLVEFVEGP
ncbi:MAG TPA: methylmalonyl-CoA epimerase [Thermoplasmata archaeon]|nr:methylmalonyl-CoA epimerase [Thermoplasmata archaeon]